MIPIVAIVGPSGSGKTTVITGVIAELTARGYRVGAIKHTHHDFEIDQPGKDSFAMKAAGAVGVILVSSRRLALIRDTTDELGPLELVARYLADLDLVLVEGFAHSELPKIYLAHDSASTPPPQTLKMLPARRFGAPEIKEIADLLEERFLL
jgi:molybdopterin-guanine dinucleotide biosynthesis protein B